MRHTPALSVTAIVAATGLLVACGQGERKAEAEVAGTEAQVTTNLPESQVSDQQLENTAKGAAEAAATPQGSATAVVVSPPESDAGAAGAQAPAQ